MIIQWTCSTRNRVAYEEVSETRCNVRVGAAVVNRACARITIGASSPATSSPAPAGWNTRCTTSGTEATQSPFHKNFAFC